MTVDIYDMAQTWNDGAATFTGIKLNVTDTASASGSLLMDLQVGGVSQFKVDKTGAVVISDGTSALTIDSSNGATTFLQTFAMTFQTSNAFTVRHGNGDPFGIRAASSGEGRLAFLSTANIKQVELTPDAANTLAQRNSTNAQTFNIYNTYTNASNYERGFMKWSSNVLEIGTEAAGTGSNRNVSIKAGSNSATLSSGGSLSLTSSLWLSWSSRITMESPSFGVFRISDSNRADFGRLQLGGTTSSFPAIKRNATGIDIRLADDSAYAPLAASTLLLSAVPTSDPEVAGQVWNHSGNLKISAG